MVWIFRLAIVLITVLVSNAFVAQSHAQLVRHTCTVYRTSEHAAPDLVKAIFAKLRAEAEKNSNKTMLNQIFVKSCQYPSLEQTSYVLRGPVWKDPLEVCHMNQTSIYPDVTDKGELILRDPPQDESNSWEVQHLFFGTGHCPSASDERYVSTERISPGVFRQVSRLWSELSSSKQAYERMTREVPPIQSRDFRPELGKKLFDTPQAHLTISLVSWFPCTDARWPCGYEVHIADSSNNAHFYVLTMDFLDDGLKIVAISEAVV
jgi:hypothetical protein